MKQDKLFHFKINDWPVKKDGLFFLRIMTSKDGCDKMYFVVTMMRVHGRFSFIISYIEVIN